MTTLDQYLEKRPIDPNRVEEHKRIMLGAVRAQRLRDLREQAGLTQAQLAARMGTGQRQVSKMENGDLENTKVGTIRRYLEAVGGTMAVEYMVGDQRIQIA